MFSIIFWASLVTGIPGGFIVDRYGPKLLFILCMMLHVVGTMLLPAAALYFPTYATLILRFVLGLGMVSDHTAMQYVIIKIGISQSMCEFICVGLVSTK
jgi:MFS family permease